MKLCNPVNNEPKKSRIFFDRIYWLTDFPNDPNRLEMNRPTLSHRLGRTKWCHQNIYIRRLFKQTVNQFNNWWYKQLPTQNFNKLWRRLLIKYIVRQKTLFFNILLHFKHFIYVNNIITLLKFINIALQKFIFVSSHSNRVFVLVSF